MSVKRNINCTDIVPIYSPRSTYKKIKSKDQKMIADMTLNFDKITINLLKQDFQKKNNELNLQQFIIIAKRHLKFWQTSIPNRQIALMRYLTLLFIEIDINGNGDMQWQEFTNYIIEKATVLKNLKSKADEIKHYVRSPIKPRIKIEGLIQKTQYINDLDKIAFYEEGANKICFMSLDNGQLSSKPLVINPKKLVVNISSVKKEKNGKLTIRKKDLVIPTDIRVLDMIYLSEKKYKILLVSTSDGYVRGWKHSQNGFIQANQPDNEQELFEHHFNSEIYCLAWDHINEVLYCGQKNGNIYMWNLKTDLEKALNESVEVSDDKQGSDERVSTMITSMITMPKLQFMASGRMDGKLILWDTINNKKKWTYKEHTRGILTLTFNEAMILLFSAGFDHKICIWNPYIKTLIHKIQAHLSPILSLKVIDGTNQLISMDSEGIVKITDTKRFNIICSFTVETTSETTQNSNNAGGLLSSFIAITNPLKLIFAGRSICIYEYDKNYNPQAADENVAICCGYVKETLSLFTPVGNKIKVWSALNGDVQKIYMEITSSEISTFDFDFLKKRMVIGDTKGNVTLHNTANGAKMKSLSKHSGEITHLVGTQNQSGTDIFISCALDNEIKISKETQESYEVIRTIFIRKDVEITCLIYCRETKLIIVGSNVGNLGFYDIETGKAVGTCLNNPDEEFTSLCRGIKQPVIIATTSTGRISFVAMPPFPNRYEKLLSFFHEDIEKEGSNLGVRTSCYSSRTNSLYIIDDKMYLACYELGEIIDKLHDSKILSEKIDGSRRKSANSAFDYVRIKKKWQIKVHSEVVKSLQYIEEENVLITTSFDKRIKIWNPENGQFVDSLQQNYNKAEPFPLAFYNTKTGTLHSPNRKHTISNVKIDPVNLEYDPFALQNTIQDDPNFQKHSNTEWILNIDFKEIAVKERETFADLRKRIDEIQEQQSKSNHLSDSELQQIKRKLQFRKQVLRDINSELRPTIQETVVSQERQACTAPSNQNASLAMHRRVSRNYFKKTIFKCVKNFVERNENRDSNVLEIEEDTNRFHKKKKSADCIPIQKIVNKKQKSFKNILEHRQHIDSLAKQETESLINRRQQRKIFISAEQASAVRKLCTLLKDGPDDRKFNQLYSSIGIKESKRLSKAKTLPYFR